MNKYHITCGNERGFSLLEALIALFITGVVAASIFGVYVNQHKNWMIQGQVTDMQQNARAAIDELTRQIRMAGYDLPLGLNGIKAYNTNPDTIIISYSTSGCDASIAHAMPTPSSELRCDGYDVSCFHENQWAYIFQPDSGGGEFFFITQVQTGSSHIQHNTMDLSKCYPTGSIVLSLQQIKYYIDRTDTTHPNLMVKLPGQNPQVYAENITDLQFRYTMKNGSTVDVPAIPVDVREVMITLIARTSDKDPDFQANPYRTRTFTSKVNLRNLDT